MDVRVDVCFVDVWKRNAEENIQIQVTEKTVISRKLHNEELYNLYYSRIIFGLSKERGEIGGTCNRQRQDVKCIHNFILQTKNVGRTNRSWQNRVKTGYVVIKSLRLWTGFISFRLEFFDDCYESCINTSVFIKGWNFLSSSTTISFSRTLFQVVPRLEACLCYDPR
jgi:hypothetical protein